MELALALLALAAALPESGAPKGESLTCSLFRDDIIGSPQSSRTTFFGRQAFAQVPVAIPAEHLYLLSQGAWIPGTHQHTEQPLVDPETMTSRDKGQRGSAVSSLSRLPVPFPVVLRFYKPPIFTEEQLASPTMLKSKPRRIPQRPARGPQDASTRTPERPAQGPQDTQREDPTTPSARTHPFTMCIVPPSWIWPKSSPRILRGTLDTWTWTHAPGTLQL